MEFEGSIVRIATGRRWKLREAVKWVLRTKRITGAELEVLLGHFT